MTTSPQSPVPSALPNEQGELLLAFAEQRELLLITTRGLTDAQAAERTTVSELTLGGIVKHLTQVERAWTLVMAEGDGRLPEDMLDPDQHRVLEGETLAGLLEGYAAAARGTDAFLAAVPDLDRRVPLPRFPWSAPETVYWSARRILLQLLRELAQHAGHADIIREALDGANTTAQR
ncbi:DinB family protein [Streptomyces sp. JNUCC 64]